MASSRANNPKVRHARTKPARLPVSRGDTGQIAPRASVDRILAQWQRERPDLDPAPMRLFGLLARTHLLTTPYLNFILAQWNLSRGTFDVLSALRRAGPPYSLTPKQLSESLMLSGAGMTSRLDRLEELQLLERLPQPNDRRSLEIRLTQRGMRLIDEIIPRVMEAQWDAVHTLGVEKAKRLIELLEAFTDALSRPGAHE